MAAKHEIAGLEGELLNTVVIYRDFVNAVHDNRNARRVDMFNRTRLP